MPYLRINLVFSYRYIVKLQFIPQNNKYSNIIITKHTVY
jgi:hypothetical protein